MPPADATLTATITNRLPKGNLDVTGRYFLWTTNLGGNRLDAFLVKIPAERLEHASESVDELRD